MCRHTRLIDLAERLRALLDAVCCESLVDGEVDAGDFATIHPLKGDKVPAFVRNGDAHWHADFLGLGARTCDQRMGVIYIKSFDRQHSYTCVLVANEEVWQSERNRWNKGDQHQRREDRQIERPDRFDRFFHR